MMIGSISQVRSLFDSAPSLFDSAPSSHPGSTSLSIPRTSSLTGNNSYVREPTFSQSFECSDITRKSTQLMERSLQGGVISHEVCMQMHAKVVKILDDGIEDFNLDRKRINEIIDSCLEEVKVMFSSHQTNFIALQDKLRERNASTEDVEIFISETNMLRENINATLAIGTSTITLIKSKDGLGGLKNLLALVFEERMREIKLLKEELGVLVTQESHMHKIDIERRNQRLKEENQFFTQFIAVVEQATQAEQEIFERDLRNRVFVHQQHADEWKMSQEEIQAKWKRGYEDRREEHNYEYRTLEEKDRTSLAQEKLRSDERVAFGQMGSQERIQTTQTIGRVLAPGGNLQSASLACTLI